MSVYASWFYLDKENMHEDCKRWKETTKERAEIIKRWMYSEGSYFVYDESETCTCGNLGPIVYKGSHVCPKETDPRGGSIEVGVIPDHCHPEAKDDEGAKVEFLRVSLDEDKGTYSGMQPGSATVVLDKKAVMELRDTLTLWLEAKERW